jgi:transmembrane sensor
MESNERQPMTGKLHTASAVDQMAADWVARSELRTLTCEEEAELEVWLGRDPRHLGAYAKARAVAVHCEEAATLRFAGSDPLPCTRHESAEEAVSSGISRRWMLAAGGGGLAASLAGGVFVWMNRETRVSTLRGEISLLPLPDGSVAMLSTDTRIAIDFSGARRLVHVLSGQVFFQVAQSLASPFVVSVDGHHIAGGKSQFSVSLDMGAASVVVVEGFVDVQRPQGWPGADRAVRVAASQKLDDRRDFAQPRLERMSHSAIERLLAWRQGQIAFDGQTLTEAVKQYGRFSDVRIMVDQDVADQRISGLFSTTDPLGFARSVATVLGLQVYPVPGGLRIAQK